MLASHTAQQIRPGDRVLDPFTGSGVLAIAAALSGAEATALDISRRAVLCARFNAHLNGCRLEAIHAGDLRPLEGRRFNFIVANPPYLPGAVGAATGSARAWEGGPDGRTFIDSLCDLAPAHLHAGGRLLIVHSSVCGEDATIRRLEGAGLQARVVSRSEGRLGPLLAARVGTLRRNGHPIGDREEILIFEGRLRGS